MNDEELQGFLLDSVLDNAVFEALAFEDQHVYTKTRETYSPVEEEGPSGEIILERASDGKRYMVHYTVSAVAIDE